MSSPLTLPIARLRAAGCKVHTIIGHDPLTTGRHPAATGRWQYGIEVPGDIKPIGSIEDALWRYDHSWGDTLGEAVARVHRDGRILVSGFARPIDNPTPARLRAHRQRVQAEVAELLARVAIVIESRKVR